MRVLAALLLAACASTPTAVPSLGLDPAVESFVNATDKGLTLTVRITAPASATWSVDEPEVQGLRVVAEPERTERAGDAVVVTRKWSLRGAPGPYVVPPVCLTVEGSLDPSPCAEPIYVDLGTRPDRSAMVDIADPPATWPALPWIQLLVGLLGVAAAVFGVRGLLMRRAPVEAAPQAIDPPHVAAIKAWERLRDDPRFTPEQKALGLSDIFRTYVELTLDFPARAWSTTETMAHLERMTALARTNLPRAKRLLRATDRVKYAEVRPGGGYFEELEADLHAFIDATRPRSMDPEAPR